MSIISGANAVVGSAVGGYQIERSLRSNGTYAGGSDYMQRQNSGTSGNRKVWTLSLWMKICNITSNDEHIWMVSNTGVGGNPSSYVRLLLENNVLKLGSNGSASEAFASTALLRDVSAWYHVVISCDNANTILRVYVNGVEWTTTNGFLASKTNPTNTDGVVNNASYYNHFCMFRTAEPRTFNGYLAEIHFVDGSALPATTFGEFNSETGVWQPIKVTGVTYGTQGYYLPLNDNASTTTLGYDAAGSNDFTLTGFSVTAGAGNDSLVDTPTPYGTDTGAGGEVRGNYCTWNPLAKNSAQSVSNGNLYRSSGSTWTSTLSTIAIPTSGKWYAEFVSDDYVYSFPGIQSYSAISSTSAQNVDFTIVQSGEYRYNGTNEASTGNISTGKIIGVAIDSDTGVIKVYVNNVLDHTYSQKLVSGTTYFFSAIGSAGLTANFGQRPFAYSAPSGFKALCTQNLPEPTIADGSAYMNAVLYNATDGVAGSVSGVGFAPDFVWVKSRSGANSHGLFDKVRGVEKGLFSNLTNAEISSNTYLTAFNSDGFSHGGAGLIANGSLVSWNWKANGAGVSNTVGTINSTVSANTTSGFSIVTYTGNNTSGATVGHGLGVQPAMVICKNRTTGIGSGAWPVWHKSLSGGNYYLFLNSTAGQSNGNNNFTSEPTSTVLNLGTSDTNNTADMVAYCFAPVAGFSAFGSFLGNNDASGPFVFCGFRPRWILFKDSTNNSTNWVLQDTERFTYNLVTAALLANTSGSESSYATGYDVDILSNGFKIRRAGGDTNQSNAKIIYAAFAENPFKYSLAR